MARSKSRAIETEPAAGQVGVQSGYDVSRRFCATDSGFQRSMVGSPTPRLPGIDGAGERWTESDNNPAILDRRRNHGINAADKIPH
jgi:hypothetical protein